MDRVRELTKQIDKKIERYESLTKMLGGKGIDYSGERVQSSLPLGSSMENALVMKDELEKELDSDVALLVRWRANMSSIIIANVEDRTARHMALMFYADCLTYKKIMRFFNMEESEVNYEKVRNKIRKAKDICIYHLNDVKW